MENQLKIVNKELQFKKVSLINPTPNFYLHIAAEIDHSIFPFFLYMSKKKKQIIHDAKKWCENLKEDNDIVSAVVFKATIIPPGKGKLLLERPNKVQIAKYDFAILIESTTHDKLENIKQSAEYVNIEQMIKKKSKFYHVTTATNVKQINSVDHKKHGVFLFNYFFADNLQQNLDIWEYTAGWFQQETGLDNSTVLLPTQPESSKYTIINHCRWNKMSDILPSLIFKNSFHSYVLENFYVNKVAAMPVLYKIV